MAQDDLHKAKKNKRDEFYTRLEDIESELKYYKDFFKSKTVFCNCDDPRKSNFFHYFSYNFEHLGLKWGVFYDKYHHIDFAPQKLEAQIAELMKDEYDEITSKKGIYEYVLSGDERALSIRAFKDSEKRAVYERQKGICPKCGKHFELDEMEADHITPYSKGGHTTIENCQMLCRDCNRRKSAV